MTKIATVSVATRRVDATAAVRHVVTAQIRSEDSTVVHVPSARGPRGKQGDRGPPGTIGGEDPVIFDGGNF